MGRSGPTRKTSRHNLTNEEQSASEEQWPEEKYLKGSKSCYIRICINKMVCTSGSILPTPFSKSF